MTFARLEPAVDFGAADGSKTDLVALLLSPADNAGDHLRALACIARTLRDSDRARPSACGEQSRVLSTPFYAVARSSIGHASHRSTKAHGGAAKTPLIDFCIGAPILVDVQLRDIPARPVSRGQSDRGQLAPSSARACASSGISKQVQRGAAVSEATQSRVQQASST